MRRAAAAIAAVLVAGLLACGGREAPAGPADCGDLAFTAQSDDGAFDIRATGVPCEQARRVAAATRARRVSDPLRYERDGFACAGTRVPGDGLAGVAWRCTRGEATITFTRN